MRRVIAIVFVLIAIAAVAAWVNREPLALGAMAGQAQTSTLEERKALIRPAMQFRPPAEGDAPYPAMLLFHGCAGMRQNFMAQWADVANAAGYMAVIVDSTGPRGIDRERALAEICGGKILIGQERAGDVLAALEIARARADIDSDRIVLAGWSHGAWSVMDLIAMDPPRKKPAGLTDATVPDMRIAGAILVYPYCGVGAWSRVRGWAAPPPALAMIAGKDTIVDSAECTALLGRLNARGAGVDVVVYPDADHVFDDPFLEPEYLFMHDADAHEDAKRRVGAFLEGVKRP